VSNVSHITPQVDYGNFTPLTIWELNAVPPADQQLYVLRVLSAVNAVRALPYEERHVQMGRTMTRFMRAGAVIHEWHTGQHLAPSRYQALIDRQGRKRRRNASTVQS
jgi:hypothetical protein